MTDRNAGLRSGFAMTSDAMEARDVSPACDGAGSSEGASSVHTSDRAFAATQQESINLDISLNADSSAQPSRRGLSPTDKAAIFLGAIAFALLIYANVTEQPGSHNASSHADHHMPSLLSVLPFAGMLLCIAILPLLGATKHWWESNKNRLTVALGFGAITLLYYGMAFGVDKVATVLEHALVVEYVPFIVLLFSLYVISGGIRLSGDLAAHPGTNTTFLAVGALIASFVGTTGASMLLIRPLLQTNSERRHVMHTVIFFIFLVSNIGGCLLPIGDPPLFLGYLRGVPFMWTFVLWKPWAVMCVAVLVVYYIWDSVAYKKEAPKDIIADEVQIKKLSLTGKLNLLWLMGVVLAVALIKPGEDLFGTGFHAFPFMRELVMMGMVLLSLRFTSKKIRSDNRFDYHAILEVAALFLGIFICMQAPIDILRGSGAALEPYLSSPMRFFWSTGILSAFLDNAPTYVVFFETAKSMTPENASAVVTLAGGGSILTSSLVAISLGSVFMGAMSYIGNGPNFMVKSIAEQSGIKMPSFFGYMLYSCGILLPLLLVVSWMFLS